jgi:hypothetical protein
MIAAEVGKGAPTGTGVPVGAGVFEGFMVGVGEGPRVRVMVGVRVGRRVRVAVSWGVRVAAGLEVGELDVTVGNTGDAVGREVGVIRLVLAGTSVGGTVSVAFVFLEHAASQPHKKRNRRVQVVFLSIIITVLSVPLIADC